MKIAAFLLLALWLPATLHCDLETAGVELHGITHEHGDGGHSHHAPCDEDSCHALDGVSYRATLASVKVPLPPALPVAIVPVLCRPAVTAPLLSPLRHPPPPDLAPSWQFVFRAAPPARAPAELS